MYRRPIHSPQTQGPKPTGKESACNAGDLGWDDPLEKEMAIHSSILAWRPHGQKSLVAYSAWGCKESNTTEVT